MSDIFREIDEELRRDNLLKLWKAYGKYVIGVVIAALLVAGGVVAWRNHQKSLRQAESVRYEAGLSLLREGKDSEAAKIFATVKGEGSGYGQLAAFEAADLAAKAGDQKAAIADYDKLAASPNVDPELRDAAILLSVMNGFADAEPKAVIERLQPLTNTGNPWRSTALELTAAAKLKAGDKAGALEIYKKLADDLTAPEGVRTRAAEMAAVLAS
ncbi:MAG TPA: tetratricopeptide repeat protein [Stellaceae bacterium]|nr:tetratricopeptide repeat protein [Stellaceae bacterium]